MSNSQMLQYSNLWQAPCIDETGRGEYAEAAGRSYLPAFRGTKQAAPDHVTSRAMLNSILVILARYQRLHQDFIDITY